jgi:signal transduction histidine kinase
MEEANQELARQNEMKDRLLSIVSHDVRAPLDSFRSILRLLMNDTVTREELPEVMTNLHTQVEQLTGFLDNLLRWTKNQHDAIKPYPVKVELSTLVNETVELLSLNAKKKHIEIHVNVLQGIMVYADQEMVKVVLRNLVFNAIKFSDAGDKIDIHANNDQGVIRVSVSDTGRGIGGENLAGLFEMSHASTWGTKGEIGMGLGLSLCKEFVEKMGGTISVTSKQGEGSCFEFTLPCFQEEVPVVKDVLLRYTA